MNNSPIDSEKLLLITDIPGYTPHISRLLCMMNYARFVTLQSVKGLSVKELDYLHDEESNSMGALLLHIASTDYYFRIITFEERELNNEEVKKWKAASDLGQMGRDEIKGNDLNYYTTILNEVRNEIFEMFKEKSDQWLEKKIKIWGGEPSNNYFLWFHVFEDEINHRGQINWIRKRLKGI